MSSLIMFYEEYILTTYICCGVFSLTKLEIQVGTFWLTSTLNVLSFELCDVIHDVICDFTFLNGLMT